jgi:hypothetical protein
MSRSVEHGQGLDLVVDVQPGAASGDLSPRIVSPERFQERAGELAETVGRVAEEFRNRLAGWMQEHSEGLKVESVEIEFGINLKAETGVVIAKATAGTTFTARVKLTTGIGA